MPVLPRFRACGLVLVVALALGCRRPVDPPAAAVRLVDRAAALVVESALDLRRLDLVAGAPRLADGFAGDAGSGLAGASLPAAFGVTAADPGRIEREREGGATWLRMTGTALFVRELPPTAGDPLEVRLTIAGNADAEFRARLLRIPADAARADAAPWAVALRDRGAAQGPALVATEERGAGGGVVHAVRLEPAAGIRFLFGVLVTAGEVRLGPLEVRALDPLAYRIAHAPALGSPWARRIEVAGDYREALVLAAPGAFTLAVPVPREGARLRLGVASLGRSDPEVAVTVTARADGAARSGRLVLSGAGSGALPDWHPFELDLDAFSGSTVEVVLAAGTPAGRVAGVAFAEPVVLPRRARAADPRPDVALLSLDTTRADRLSLYGHVRPTSPHLERIAAGAVVFDHAIAPETWTLPSHVSLFSGQHADRHGVTAPLRQVDPQALPLLAVELRAAGYRTVAITAGGYVHPDFGFAAGFGEYRVYDPLSHPIPGQEERAEIVRRARQRITDVLADDDPRPLFLFVHTYAAHEYWAEEDDLLAVGAPPAALAELTRPTERDTLRYRMKTGGGAAAFATELARLRLRYDASLRKADRLVGDVADRLAARDRERPHVLVVTSDHGEELGEHGSYGHGHQLHEEMIRVPLVVRAPGVVPGRVADVVSLIDIAPTLRELTGRPAAPGVDGRSLVPLVQGRRQAPLAALAVCLKSYEASQRALRGARWKLVVTTPKDGTGTAALYDLTVAGAADDQAAALPDLTRKLAGLLEERVAGLAAAAAGAREGALSADRAAELRALGYLGDG